MSSRNLDLSRASSISTKASRRSRPSRVSIQNIPLQRTPLLENTDPHILSLQTIPLQGYAHDKLILKEKHLIVPPTSPRGNFIFGRSLDSLPEKFSDINDFDVPYVRIFGIRKCIEILANNFGCRSYRTNNLHFWFLDFVTDCLWRCQDEYFLNEELQKKVLEWVLYFFNTIRDPKLNLSRGQFFRFFREAMITAEDRIETGQAYLTSPEELFDIIPTDDKSVDYDSLLSESTDSSLSSEESDSDNSYLVIASKESCELPDFYKLPKKECKCCLSASSSIETLSENSLFIEDGADSKLENGDLHYNSETDVPGAAETISLSEFYQADRKVHSRFLEEIDEEDDKSAEQEGSLGETTSDLDYEWINESDENKSKPAEKTKSMTSSSHDVELSVQSSSKKMRSLSSRRSKTDRKSVTEENMNEFHAPKKQKNKPIKDEKKLTEKDLMKAWLEFNIWEQRAKDMADPSKGWLPPDPGECDDDCICAKMEYTSEDFEDEEYVLIKNEWLQYLEKYKLSITEADHNKFINSCLLLIVRQIIFEYFYESFQYKLIKMTYQTPPPLIVEKLNDNWLIPKTSKDDFKRPVEKKPKPEKVKKEKQPKPKKEKKTKDKESKKSKSTKSTEKKEKKPKVKPEKPHKLTKEEKAEIERLKREEQKKLEEEIAAEEHKRFLYPLKLAANEQFFKSIFENYASTSEKNDKKNNNKKKRLGK